MSRGADAILILGAVVAAGGAAGCHGLSVGFTDEGTTSGQLLLSGPDTLDVTIGKTTRFLDAVTVVNQMEVGTTGVLNASFIPSTFFAVAVNGCTAPLEGGGSCTLGIDVTPMAWDVLTADLVVTDGTASGSVTVIANAAGLKGNLLMEELATPVGCTSNNVVEVLITNEGFDDSTLVNVGLSGGLISAPGSPCVPGLKLAPDLNCTVPFQARPQTEGPHLEKVTVVGQPGGTAIVNVDTTGLPNLSARPATLTLDANGTAATGDPLGLVTVTLGTMVPTGLQARIAGPDAGAFTILSDGCSSPPVACGTCVIQVLFSARSAPGTYNATLMVTGGAATTTVALVGVR